MVSGSARHRLFRRSPIMRGLPRIVRKKKGLREERTHTALNSPCTERTLTIIYIGHFWEPV